MFKKRMSVMLFIAVSVIFASCSSSSSLIGEAQSNIKSNNYTAADSAAEMYIQQNPQDPLGYYYKGVALGQKAQAENDPSTATPLFKQMNDAFSKAQEVASSSGNTPKEINNIAAVKSSFWRQEHNKAVAYVNNDSLKQTTDNPLDMSVAHLQNATVIEPDSALSWNVLALVQNKRQKYGEAAKAQSKYIGVADSVDAKDYLLLSQFYRLNNQMPESISALEEGHKKFPDNTKLVENLADTYSKGKESQKAISIVEDLVKRDPSNPQYHLSLGTQIYKSALTMQNGYDSNNDKIYDLQQSIKNAQGNTSKVNDLTQQMNDLKSKNQALESKINSLTDRAVEQLNMTLKYRSDDKVAYNTLGIIYQNKAKTYFDKRNMTMDNTEAQKYDAQAKDLLRKSMNNYEKAAQLDPNNPKYWKSLYQIYTALGMDQKAKEAEQKAGMQ